MDIKPILIPDQHAVDRLMKCIFNILFPAGHAGTEVLQRELEHCLRGQLPVVLPGQDERHEAVIACITGQVPGILETLLKDAAFILASDPAATGIGEVIAIYPGFYAIFCYRIAHLVAGIAVPLLPRMITEHAHRLTGIDIHPSAVIGAPFSIDHGTGIVIGETAVIGNRVKMYQGVTLGALSVDKSKASKKRHPTIEDDVVLYAGCTILGGATVVGRNSIIGGNVWLTESISPDSVVYHKSEIVVRRQRGNDEAINFII